MALRQRLARLLASGFEPKLVARIAGIPYAQLVTLLQDEEFRAQLELTKMGALDPEPENEHQQAAKEEVAFKDALAIAETAALRSMQDRLDLMEHRTVVQAFQAIGQRREAIAKQENLTKALEAASAKGAQTTVIINLPNIVVPELNISAQGEVVGVGSRSTVPLGRESLTALIEGELAHEQLPEARA